MMVRIVQIIKVDGNTFTENDEAFTTTTSNTVTDKGAGFWASNDKGWWIQYNDGSYLTNAWYQSPASGLWYYMGADGYMLTDTYNTRWILCKCRWCMG
ncbi:MAG: hypothetical protein ACLR0U_28375 [Enterocloster clostridioformis]